MSAPSTLSSTEKKRPLSPHLQIYMPQTTSVLSILHRMTGAALAIGILLVCWFFLALASGPQSFGLFQNFCSSPLGLLMLLGWSFALFYHLCNGIRHLVWDTGHLFDVKKSTGAGYAVLLVAAFLTAAVWLFAAYF